MASMTTLSPFTPKQSGEDKADSPGWETGLAMMAMAYTYSFCD